MELIQAIILFCSVGANKSSMPELYLRVCMTKKLECAKPKMAPDKFAKDCLIELKDEKAE